MRITAGIITLNESQSLPACLRSLQGCDEILVVDSGSTDTTRELASNAGARVLTRTWTGYADQRNFLLSQAQNTWVFFLDADERLPENGLHTLRAALQTTDQRTAAFRFPRKSFYFQRWISHGGWYPDYQVRLLHRERARYVQNLVHERVEANGPVLTVELPLLHYPFTTIADQVETNNRYSSLLAEQLAVDGRHFRWRHLLTKPVVKFIECYVIKRGFLDGFPGFCIAVSAGYSVFLKWCKLWEQQRLSRSSL